MKARNVAIVFRKELTDTLRDRRTLISSLLLPLLLFPLLLAGVLGLTIIFVQRAERQTAQLVLLGEEHAPELARRIRSLEGVSVLRASNQYVQLINEKKLQAAVEFPPGLEINLRQNADQTQRVKVYWYEGELRSRFMLRRLQKVVKEYRDEIVKVRLAAHQLTAADARPFEFEQKNVAEAEKVTGNVLGFILPYFIIILCLTGAMYPAMDLTAGEKERGTMETILASPAGRGEIVLGKFLVVLLTSLTTTALSILSFAVTVIAGASALASISKEFVVQVSARSAATVFVVVLPLAVAFSAALMAISLIARNYREAQGYLAPLMFVVILPAMGSFLPGIELNAKLAMVPILNVSLLAKEIFAGQYSWKMMGMIFGWTCLYAAVALWFAARQFRREEVLFRT